MKFKDPKKIRATIDRMVDAQLARSRNRARINSVFNGDPPYTDQEAEENSIFTNVNFLEGTELLHKARSQFTNAFQKPGKFFTISLDFGPPHKRREWATTLTTQINKAMKKSPRYYQGLKDQFAGVVLHGIGPVSWFRERDWCPKSHGIEDVLVPSNTLTSFENLSYFAIYTTFTAAELVKKTSGENADKGWNQKLVKACLKWLLENTAKDFPSITSDAAALPEKIEEDFKENAGYWSSDATPVIKAYDFYYLDDEDDEPTWRRKIVLDGKSKQIEGSSDGDTIVLYDGESKSYGDQIQKILQCQYADGSVVPPFRFHSVRSLGYLLYAVTHLQNRLRCKFNDSVFEAMIWYFRGSSGSDAEKLQKVDLHHLGIIPDGLTWVPGNERHTIDEALVNLAMGQNRQLMAEHSSTYVQDVERNAPSSNPTATEIMAKVNSSNAMIGSMLTDAYTLENYKHIEIARRFATIDHKECKAFRETCMREGVPMEVFANFEGWEVTTERNLGSGNKMLEIAAADRLMAVKDTAEIEPTARKRIMRIFITANTDDPGLANDLVPVEDNQPTQAQQMATLAWGTLIDGKPVIIAEAINRIEYVQTLLQMLDQDLTRIEQAGGNPPLDRVLGLANVIQHIVASVQILAVDENMKPLVKQAMDALGNAGNLVKAYMERLQEAAQEQGQQMDPADLAKIQAMMVTAESKARISEENAAQKRRHKEIAFVQDQNRRNEATRADLSRKAATTGADIEAGRVRTAAEIEATDHKTRADIIRENVVAASQPKDTDDKKKKKK